MCITINGKFKGMIINERENILRHAVETFGSAVYRFAYSQTRSHHQAEDVYQETFAALYTSNKVFDNDYHLKSWLMKVVVNKCRNMRREAYRRREIPSNPLEPNVLEQAAPSEETDDGTLWDIVDQLTDEFKIVIHLHYVDGYSTNEIASIVGASPATVRTRLFRGRAKVKKLLEAGEA